MSYLTVPTADRQAAPFRIERFLREEKPDRFIPDSRLVVTPGLSNSDLLGGSVLTEEAARTLLAVLALLSPSGILRPTIFQIASLLGMSEQAARERLQHMANISWRGEPLLLLDTADSGIETVIVSPLLVHAVEGDNEEILLSEAQSGATRPETIPSAPPPPPIRDQIIAHSRATYARPREEVERDVLRQLGHYPEETEEGPVGDAWRRLSTLGIANDTIHDLMEAYPLDEIVNQLDWLPVRNDVRNPARFIVAAIEGNYEPPARIRLEAALGDAEAAMNRAASPELVAPEPLPSEMPVQEERAEGETITLRDIEIEEIPDRSDAFEQ